MQPPQNNLKTKKLIIVALAVVLLLVIVIGVSHKASPKPDTPTEQSTTPPVSQDVIPDNNAPTTQTGSDFAPLINAGLSTRQVDGLQYAIYNFAQPQNISVQNTVVKTDVNHQPPTETTGNIYTFTLQLDASHSYKATLETDGLYTIRLGLFDIASGQQVYDSKTIDSSKLN